MHAELHCHSRYSPDCALSLEAIISRCQQLGITLVALTDHNEIAGAVELQRIAPDWLTVIIGEEIASSEGDVIGLFLQERIAPRQPIHATIEAIHAQGGIALLPHPFDRIRREAVGRETVEAIRHSIDAMEVFNARCLFPADNTRAARYARDHQIRRFVGSDAHTLGEYGNALCLLPPDTPTDLTPARFLTALDRAHFRIRSANPLVHLTTAIVKRRKRTR